MVFHLGQSMGIGYNFFDLAHNQILFEVEFNTYYEMVWTEVTERTNNIQKDKKHITSSMSCFAAKWIQAHPHCTKFVR